MEVKVLSHQICSHSTFSHIEYLVCHLLSSEATLSTMTSCYVTFNLETISLVYMFVTESSICSLYAAYRKLSFKIFNPLTLALLIWL